MGNNNLDGNEHPANLAPRYDTDTHTSGCTQALALDPEAVAEDRFDSGDICRISVQDAS